MRNDMRRRQPRRKKKAVRKYLHINFIEGFN